GRAPRRARPRAAALRRRALPGWPGGPRRRFAHRRSRRRGQVAAGDMLARVKGPLRFAVSAVLLVAAGAGAYLLGAWLRPEPPPAGTALQNPVPISRSEEHTSELQSRENLVCRLLLEKKKQ